MTGPYEPALLDSLEALRLGEWQRTVWRQTSGTHCLSIHLLDVIDLRESDTLAEHGYPPEVLVGEGWDLPQRLGGAVAWLGVGGLIVPSARHADGNLVVYVANLGPEDLVEVLSDGERDRA